MSNGKKGGGGHARTYSCWCHRSHLKVNGNRVGVFVGCREKYVLTSQITVSAIDTNKSGVVIVVCDMCMNARVCVCVCVCVCPRTSVLVKSGTQSHEKWLLFTHMRVSGRSMVK
jgi:hypothetical protein